MSVLSRTAKLGIAAESVPGVYELPAFPIVFSSGAKYKQVITPLRDKALRGSDSELQDLLQVSGTASGVRDVPRCLEPLHGSLGLVTPALA